MIALDYFGGCNCNTNVSVQDLFKIYSGNEIPKNKLCDGIENFMNNKDYAKNINIKEINPLQTNANKNAFNYGLYKNISLDLIGNLSNALNHGGADYVYIKADSLFNVGDDFTFKGLTIDCNFMMWCFNDITNLTTHTGLENIVINCKNMNQCFARDLLGGYSKFNVNVDSANYCFQDFSLFDVSNHNVNISEGGACFEGVEFNCQNAIMNYNFKNGSSFFNTFVCSGPYAELNITCGDYCTQCLYEPTFSRMNLKIGDYCSEIFCSGNSWNSDYTKISFTIDVQGSRNSWCFNGLRAADFKYKNPHRRCGYSCLNDIYASNGFIQYCPQTTLSWEWFSTTEYFTNPRFTTIVYAHAF